MSPAMTKTSFDLVVVGGGPGGYVAAIRAAQLGLSTALAVAPQLIYGDRRFCRKCVLVGNDDLTSLCIQIEYAADYIAFHCGVLILHGNECLVEAEVAGL